MEPDILSSAGEVQVRGTGLPTSVENPVRNDSVEATAQTGPVAPSRLHASGSPAAAWPRPAVNGNGAAHPNGNGYANGHARPRSGALGAWSQPRLAVASPAAAPVLPFETPAPEGIYLRFGKRALDIVLSLLALIAHLPVFAVLAVLIRLESPGPVFYRSVRIGRGGRAFTFFKLRSMVLNADRKKHTIAHMNEAEGPVFKIARDPRITRIGKLLRSTSLDEIPQFYNVLIGDMSLVGPRPPIPNEVSQYEPWQLRRLDVRPGITCLWQISGRSRIGFHEWMRLDLEYIKHQSLALDLKILLRTIPAVLSREGAY
jgi:exopolysaccharide biosynthesis polyprenyl glycosylphosphotransferase